MTVLELKSDEQRMAHEDILKYIKEIKREKLLKKLKKKLRIFALIPIGVWYGASRVLPFDLIINPDVAKGITSVGKYLSNKYLYKDVKDNDWDGRDEVEVDFYEYTDLLRTMFDGFENYFGDRELLKRGGKLILKLHDDSKDLGKRLKIELKRLKPKWFDYKVEVHLPKKSEKASWGSLDELEIDFDENTDLFRTLFDSKEKLSRGGKLIINLHNDNKRLETHLKSELKHLKPELFDYEVDVWTLEGMSWDGLPELEIDYTKDIILYNELFCGEQPLARDGKLILNYYGNDKIVKHQVERDKKRFSKYFDVEVNHFEEWDGKDEVTINFNLRTNLYKTLFCNGQFLKSDGKLRINAPVIKYKGDNKKKGKNVRKANKMITTHLNNEIIRLKPKCYDFGIKIKLNKTYL